jgi:predicted CoA-binding protein
MTQQETRQILAQYKVIAVVGLSDDENKPSYDVAAYMQAYGYQIIPVNPFVEEVLGEKSYQSLLDIPPEIQKTIEIVDIFRRPADVLPIVEQAVALKQKVGKPYVVWMQLGIVNEAAAELARNAGLTVVMNKCIKVEHNRHF